MEKINFKGYNMFPFNNLEDAVKTRDNLYPQGIIVQIGHNEHFLIKISNLSYVDQDGKFNTTKELD